MMVRAVGIEPTLLSEPDFESGASTSFTTPACWCSANGKIGGHRPAKKSSALNFSRLRDRKQADSVTCVTSAAGYKGGIVQT